MKFEIPKNRLMEQLNMAEKIAGKNLTLPVLQCLLLVAKDKTLTIKATNLDLGIEITIPAKVESEGIVAVPGHILSSYITTIASDKALVLEEKEGNLYVTSPSGATTIKCFPYEDFPLIPHLTESEIHTISAKDFALGLKSVWYSASPSSIKPELSSIFIHTVGGKLVFAATDSFRLAEKSLVWKGSEEIPSLLIPFKNVAEIMRFLEANDGTVTLAVTKNQISFTAGSNYLTSRVVDGSFPDYRQIIPKASTTEAIVLKSDIVTALRAVTVFSDKFNQTTLLVDPEQKIFKVKAKNSDVGEGVETISGALSGDPLEVSFNVKYITDAFQAIPSDSISFKWNGAGRPLLIEGNPDHGFTYIVMPMNR